MKDDSKDIPTDAIGANESTRTRIEDPDDKKLLVKKGLVDSISIYEVSESELIILENGSPNSLHLNFLIFFLTTFLSFLTTLLTANFSNKIIVQTIFIIITVISGFLAIVFLFLILRGKSEFKSVIKRIKERIK